MFQFEKVTLWRNSAGKGDLIRRKMVDAPDRKPTRVVENLSLLQRITDGHRSYQSAYDPAYSEYYAAKEAAKLTGTPFEDMRGLLRRGEMFSYSKQLEVPTMGIINMLSNDSAEIGEVRRGHFENNLTLFLRWHANQAREGLLK